MARPDNAPALASPSPQQMQKLVTGVRTLLPPMEFAVFDLDAALAAVAPDLVDSDAEPIEPFMSGFTFSKFLVEDGTVLFAEHGSAEGPNDVVISHKVLEPDRQSGIIFRRTKEYSIDTDTFRGSFGEDYRPIEPPRPPVRGTLNDLRELQAPENLQKMLEAAILAASVESPHFDMNRYNEAVHLLGQCGVVIEP